MGFDRNPHFGKDQSFVSGAGRTLDLLWDTTNGEVSAFPKSYLENLRYEFSDGDVSMLELMDRVDLGKNATYEDYCEVRDNLIKVDPHTFPNPDSVVEVFPENLKYDFEPDFDFSEFDFADEVIEEAAVSAGPGGVTEEEGEEIIPEGEDNAMSEKMELFFKKVISSVYLDGVTNVTDREGNPPNMANNYLMAPDGKSFSGIFYDSPPTEQAKKFPFEITEGAEGQWAIKY